jgi:hypothetical protein
MNALGIALGAAFGLITAVITVWIVGSTGPQLPEILWMTAFGGFSVGAVVGFMLGTLPIFNTQPSRKPQKHISAFPPQIAGQSCGVCANKILFVMDGKRCERCHTVFHEQCTATCPRCGAASEK